MKHIVSVALMFGLSSILTAQPEYPGSPSYPPEGPGGPSYPQEQARRCIANRYRQWVVLARPAAGSLLSGPCEGREYGGEHGGS